MNTKSTAKFSGSYLISVVLHVGLALYLVNLVHPILKITVPTRKPPIIELAPPPPPPPPPPPKEPPPPPKEPPPPRPNTPPPPQQIVSAAQAPPQPNEVTVPPPPPPEPPPPAQPTKVVTGVPSAYWNTVQGIIAQTVIYPPKAQRDGEEGTVKMRVHIRPDGTVLNVEIVERCGVVALDNEAKDVFKRIGKFPPLPNSDPDAAEYVFEIPINFTLSG